MGQTITFAFLFYMTSVADLCNLKIKAMIGKLVKPTEGERWYSLEPLPHFCNNYKWDNSESEEIHQQINVAEFLWTQHNLKILFPNQGIYFPLLCYFSISCMYDPEKKYEDESSKEYDRFCIEELDFRYLDFDEGNWTSLIKLCELDSAKKEMIRIREKMKELNFPEDAETNMGTGFHQFEQTICPRFKNICLIGQIYCPECGLNVRPDLMDWSPYENKKSIEDNVK